MKLRIVFPASESTTPFEVEFPTLTAEPREVLNDFISYSDEAHRTCFARELSSYKISFHLTNSGAIKNNGIVPDEEALSTFLHKYRPIMLKNEPTEFSNVCSLLVRHIANPEFTKAIKTWKTEYSGKNLREICRMEQGDYLLTSQIFLENYLNAFEYHRDRQLRRRLSGFAATFEPAARRGLVTLLLTLKFSAVSRLRLFIKEMLRKDVMPCP
jgi:hypothetical protein